MRGLGSAQYLEHDRGRIDVGVRMGFYRDQIYPRLVNILGDPVAIRERRRQLLPQARGTVLEIGVGPGANFDHYEPARVDKIYALEPNPEMVRLAERRLRRTALTVEFLGAPGERIPLADVYVDTVVSTFTLCTIPGVVDALRDVHRVMKPGGRLIFLEISASPDPRVRRWQRRWEPLHHALFDGLFLTRDIPSLLKVNGFSIESVDSGYMARFPKSWAHCCWGSAVRD
jgi:SAM-dependent methyltransferase